MPRVIGLFLPKKKGGEMAVVAPWYSILEPVYHNNDDCNTGNNIETENRRAGTGDKELCKECARLA
jgi:hypothetical protein